MSMVAVGNPAVLMPPSSQFTVGANSKVAGHHDDLCVATGPVIVWLPNGIQYKYAIVKQLSTDCNITMEKNMNEHFLFKNPITMSNEDLVELLDMCTIPTVTVVSYGQKCKINCGNKLTHQMRTIDPQVAISFDI